MRFVDTNIFLYKMLRKPRDIYERCTALIDRLEKGREATVTSPITICEIAWVLESKKGWTKDEVKEKVDAICSLSGLHLLPIRDHNVLIDATRLYRDLCIDYDDALNALLMRENGIAEVYSYDRHFDKIEFVKRIVPGEVNPSKRTLFKAIGKS